MSYQLVIAGHKDNLTVEDGQAFENDVLAKARVFVASLEGVSMASGTFQFLGGKNLLPESSPEPAAQ